MKKKMVVKVSMNGEKSRSKALKVAVGLLGVESASLKGDDKSQLEITGDGVDPVELTSLLRKNVGHAELVTVDGVDGEKKDDEKDDTKSQPSIWTPHPPYVLYEMPYGYAGYGQYHDNSVCSIM